MLARDTNARQPAKEYDDLSVIFYHNRFATVPLEAPVFRGENFHHLQKVPDEPWKWIALE
jgi:hypothetical protein